MVSCACISRDNQWFLIRTLNNQDTILKHYNTCGHSQTQPSTHNLTYTYTNINYHKNNLFCNYKILLFEPDFTELLSMSWGLRVVTITHKPQKLYLNFCKFAYVISFLIVIRHIVLCVFHSEISIFISSSTVIYLKFWHKFLFTVLKMAN